MSSDVRSMNDDDPTCMLITKRASSHDLKTGSQYPVWIDGSPSLVGFSENAMHFAPRAAVRSISAAAAAGSHNGMIIIGMKRPGYASLNSSRMKSFHVLRHTIASSLSLAS